MQKGLGSSKLRIRSSKMRYMSQQPNKAYCAVTNFDKRDGYG